MEIVTRRENILRGTGPTAVNAAKTHCIHGHEFTPENTLPNQGARKCRTCHLAILRVAYAKRRDTTLAAFEAAERRGADVVPIRDSVA